MANNRMVLVCRVCRSGHAIAKWFPGQAWYTPGVEDYQKRLDAFLERHDHQDTGETEHRFELVYEAPEEWNYEQTG